ncbi:unnamed protein product, partial [Strongylus vulgaris]
MLSSHKQNGDVGVSRLSVPFFCLRRSPIFPLDWTSEPFCILKNIENCPTGFTFEELKLSLQTDVAPNVRGHDGTNLMHLGFAGDSKLQYDAYDA